MGTVSYSAVMGEIIKATLELYCSHKAANSRAANSVVFMVVDEHLTVSMVLLWHSCCEVTGKSCTYCLKVWPESHVSFSVKGAHGNMAGVLVCDWLISRNCVSIARDLATPCGVISAPLFNLLMCHIPGKTSCVSLINCNL